MKILVDIARAMGIALCILIVILGVLAFFPLIAAGHPAFGIGSLFLAVTALVFWLERF